MARLSVGIGADVRQFVAGMNTMSAAARATSASIKSTLDKTLNVGGSATGTRQAAAAMEKLTKARVAQEAAVRRIAQAEQKLIEVNKGRVASETALRAATERQTKSRQALQRIDRDAANERLKIQQKEEGAVRRLGIAEAKAAQFKKSNAKATTAEMRAWAQAQGLQVGASGPLSGATKAAYKSATSTSAQLRAEDALASAQERHARVQRDSSNEILKARQAEKSQLDRLRIAEKDYAAAKDKTSVSGLRKARELKNAENAAAQASRTRGLAAAEQATILEQSSRKVAQAQKHANDVAGTAGGSQTARLSALSALTAAQEAHTQAVRNSANADADAATKRGTAARALANAEADLKTAQTGRASSRSAIMAAENSVASARDAHAKAIRDEAAAVKQLNAAQATGTAFNPARLQAVGTAMVKVGAVGAVGFGLLAKAAADWESQFVGVEKTVDFSNSSFGTTTQAVAGVEAGLRDLAKTMPTAHSEIAEVAEELGAMGVKADGLKLFTKTALQLGETTNLTAKQAATGLAQISIVMGRGAQDVDNLGSALVGLGVSSNSTERQILDTASRIASAGNLVGLKAEDVLAFGSALASTGIRAEAGGNNMATTLLKVDAAVREGGTNLATYAQVSGVSAAKFAKAWKDDPAQAMVLFEEGLGRVIKKGGDANKILRGLGIVNVRERTNVLNLASANKLLAAQIEIARRESEKGTKLNELASKRYLTSSARVQIAWNNINDAAITAGGNLLPVVSQMADSIAKMSQGFGQLEPATQGFIVKGGAIAAVGLLALGGLTKLTVGLITIGGALKTAAAGAGGFATILRGIGAVALPVAATYAALSLVLGAAAPFQQKIKTQDELTKSLIDLSKAGKNQEKQQKALNELYNKPTGMDQFIETMRFAPAGPKNMTEALNVLSAKGLPGVILQIEKFRQFLTPFDQGLEKAEKQVDAADDALANLVQNGNLEAAQKGFKIIADDAVKKGVGLDRILPQFEDYKIMLKGVAEETYGVVLSDAELHDYMQGKIPKAISTSTQAALDHAKSQRDVQRAILGTSGALETLQKGVTRTTEESTALAASLFVQGNQFQNVRSTHIGFAEAVDAAAVAYKKNGEYVTKNKHDLADNTVKARENATALANLGTTGKAYIESLVLQGKGSKRVKEATQAVRDEVVKAGKEFGLSGTAAEHYADDLGLIPGEVSTKINAFVEAAQEKRVNDFVAQMEGLPKEVKTKLWAIYEDKGAAAALKYLEKYEDTTYTITYVTEGANLTKQQAEELNAELDDIPKEQAVIIAQQVVDKGGSFKEAMQIVKNIKDKKIKVSVIGAIETKAEADKINKSMKGLTKGQKAKVYVTAVTKGTDAAEKQIKRFKDKNIKITTKGDNKEGKKVEKEVKNSSKTEGNPKVKTKGDNKEGKKVEKEVKNSSKTKGEPKVQTKGDNKQGERVEKAVKAADKVVGNPKVKATGETKGATDAANVVKNAKSKTVTITIKANTSGAKTIMDAISGVKNKTIKITIKANTAGAKSVQDAISGTKNKTIRITIKANTSGAKNVQDAISGVKNKTITVKIKGDASGAKNVADAISGVKAKTVKVTVTGSNTGATGAKKAIGDVKGKSVLVKVNSDTSGATRARNAISSVNSKTVTITTVQRTVKRASGGPVFGPGSGTSDSIPAMLSNGEFVIRAAAVKAIGMGALYALNAQGYASGGPVGTPNIGAIDYKIIAALIKALTNPVGAVNAARARVTRDTPPATRDARAAAAAKKLADAKNKEEAADKKAADKTKGKTAADKEYARTKKESTAASNAYTKAVDKANKSSQKLKESTEALKQAQKELSDAARQVSTELATPYRSASNDIGDWLEQMKVGQVDLAAFQKQVVALRKSGLSETLIQQIANKGAIAGQELAGQILAGGKAMVDSLNSANKGLQTAADSLGYVTASGTGRYAMGGPVVGVGTGTSDSIPARLSTGEYVVNAAASAMNRGLLDMINYGRSTQPQFIPSYAQGGYVSRPTQQHTDYHAGDVNLYGVIGDPDLWLRKAQQSKHDSQVMHGLQRQFV